MPPKTQRFHLVLDLDATCVSSRGFNEPQGEKEYQQIMEVIKDIAKTDVEKAKKLFQRVHLFTLPDGQKMWSILRPDIFEFIEFSTYYFEKISVWSAGQDDYVNEIVSLLFPIYMPTPEIILTRSECEREKNVLGKPLRKLVEYICSKQGGCGDPLQTMLIVDDRCDIAKDNLHNLVNIPQYDHPNKFTKQTLLNEKDTAFKDFTLWLMRPEVMSATDVRTLDKSRIFLTPSEPRKKKRKSPSSPIKKFDLPALTTQWN